jgi:hypothetical protein
VLRPRTHCERLLRPLRGWVGGVGAVTCGDVLASSLCLSALCSLGVFPQTPWRLLCRSLSRVWMGSARSRFVVTGKV